MPAQVVASHHLLIVDDDALILAFVASVLTCAGYHVTQADSGETALSLALENPPDLALLDVAMPGMSGIELARRLQEETTTPVMFLSAHGEIDIVKDATALGAVGYLVKPVEATQIVPAVEAALARAEDIKRLRRTEANLTTALAAGRETSMAVGLLMTRFQTDRETAFEVLRDFARSRRRKINEVADELLKAEETLNAFRSAFLEHARSR
ncbi:ANTAR domain-containing response regulator [Noviherbaspirillum sp. Root189]|uniref:ANTAR domain-containing response regulator n=1 Tax=Noviherbaspirillum sp. Root189 TaxID=1736487 RepID=UPI00070C20EF|nr:response regulator [Noviherbaspirillum sp. Root189]KRB94000.1 response regulator receiver protein [Noviherbaspirillum sp. Root189]